MDLKSLIVGILLGASLLVAGIGLKNLKLGLAALALEIVSALIAPALAFVLLPVLFLALLLLAAPAAAASGAAYLVRAISGPLQGRSYILRVNEALSFGRENCDVLFPADTPGVSRRHCSLQLINGRPYLRDDASQYGTFILSPSPRRLGSGSSTLLEDNSCFCLAQRELCFQIHRK